MRARWKPLKRKETINIRNLLYEAGYEEIELFVSRQFDKAIIGVVDQHGMRKVVYDFEKMVELMHQRSGIPREEAREAVEHNINIAMEYMDNPPIIMYRVERLL